MLAWITQKFARADDSLATEAGVRALLDAIAQSKPALALDDIGERFSGAAELGLDPAACRSLLKRLDEAARPPLDALSNSLFEDGLGTSIMDTHWRALASYHRNVFSGYVYCLEQLPPPGELDAAERQDALVLANRAMAALVSHKALMRVRYRDPHPAFWTDAHAMLTRALHYGFARAPVRLYPAAVQQSTVEREYLTGLLFDVAPTGNLLPTQTHCLHLMLRYFNEHFRLADNYDVTLPFYVDPAKGKPPQRWLAGLKPRAGVRFFGCGDAHRHLDALRTAAHAGAPPPKWVRQSRIDAERYRALLDMLMEHWSEHPPQRSKRRDRQVAAIFVTHGFDQVYRMLAYSRFAKDGRQLKYAEMTSHDLVTFKALRPGAVDAGKLAAAPGPQLTPMAVLHTFEEAAGTDAIERWSVIDTSDGGLGAVAERHHGWSRAGMLIGFRYHDSIDWRVATARRIGRTPQGKLRVGLACQTEIVGCARLRLRSADHPGVWAAAGVETDAHAYADAILVSGAQPMLIAASGTYAPDRECTLLVEQRTHDIRFGQLIERGFDFECIAFAPTAAD